MWSKRVSGDMARLQEAGYAVFGENGAEATLKNFCVTMNGPKDTPYEGHQWDIRFTIPEQFPFKSPSVGFVQHIYHPNIDFSSGSVCLDTLNSQWSPMFTLLSLVETQLPYLLSYPNPADPLNKEAASQYTADKTAFSWIAKQQAEKYSRKGG